MHAIIKQFSDKFNNGWKKSKWPIYCDFSHFTSITWPCGRDNLKKMYVSFPSLLCMLLVTKFSNKFNNGWKKIKMADLLSFLHFTSIIWPCGRDNMKSFPCILPKFVMHVTNDQFSDKFENGWKKSKWQIYCAFLHFTLIIRHCGRNNFRFNNVGGLLLFSLLIIMIIQV